MRKQYKEELIDKSLLKTQRALKKAQEVAEYNKDIEALVIIAERWLQFTAHVKALDKPAPQMLGFTPTMMEEEEDE